MFLALTKKSPYYQLIYEVNGRRTQISTQKKTQAEAEKFMQLFQIQKMFPVFNQPKQQQQTNKLIILSKFEDEYVKYTQLSKSKHYVRAIKLSFKHFKSFVGDIPLTKIELKQIDQFISSVYSRSENGAAMYYRTLKAAFSKAVIWNYLSDNPFKKIKAPKVSKSYPVFISETELQLILEKTSRQFLKDIFVIAFYSGLRISEILNLKWNWIDESQNTITTKISDVYKTKSKRERIIPIHTKIQEIFSRLKTSKTKSSNFVFNQKGGFKYNEDFISKQFKVSVRAAKLNDSIHLHTLRHSFCSNLVQKGASLYVVKELAGHQNLVTTQNYSHLTQSNLMNAIELL